MSGLVWANLPPPLLPHTHPQQELASLYLPSLSALITRQEIAEEIKTSLFHRIRGGGAPPPPRPPPAHVSFWSPLVDRCPKVRPISLIEAKPAIGQNQCGKAWGLSKNQKLSAGGWEVLMSGDCPRRGRREEGEGGREEETEEER